MLKHIACVYEFKNLGASIFPLRYVSHISVQCTSSMRSSSGVGSLLFFSFFLSPAALRRSIDLTLVASLPNGTALVLASCSSLGFLFVSSSTLSFVSAGVSLGEMSVFLISLVSLVVLIFELFLISKVDLADLMGWDDSEVFADISFAPFDRVFAS